MGLARSLAAPVEDLHDRQAGKVFLVRFLWWQALTRPPFRNSPSPGLKLRKQLPGVLRFTVPSLPSSLHSRLVIVFIASYYRVHRSNVAGAAGR